MRFINTSSIDLFILLGGQSNAQGTTDNTPPLRSELSGDINQAYIYTGLTYATLNYPNNNDGLLFGCELSLAYNYTYKSGRPIYIEKHAVSATSIEVNPSGQDWNVTTDELIVDLRDGLTRLKNKAAELESKNPKFVLIWIQGEKDAREGWGLNYQSNFQAILDDINSIQQLDYCVLNVLSDDIIPAGFDTQDLLDTQNSQRALVVNDYVELLEMTQYQLGNDDLHFTADAQQIIGDDIFQMIKLKFDL